MSIDRLCIDLQTKIDLEIEKGIIGYADKIADESKLSNMDRVNLDSVIDLGVSQALASAIKKRVDKVKKELDEAFDDQVDEGGNRTFFHANGIEYQKKRNRDTEALDAKQLCNELLKLGVDPDVLNKAKDASMKKRKGNTYYIVGNYEG